MRWRHLVVRNVFMICVALLRRGFIGCATVLSVSGQTCDGVTFQPIGMAIKNMSYTSRFVRRSRRIIRHVEAGLAQTVEAVANEFVRRVELAIFGPRVFCKVGI